MVVKLPDRCALAAWPAVKRLLCRNCQQIQDIADECALPRYSHTEWVEACSKCARLPNNIEHKQSCQTSVVTHCVPRGPGCALLSDLSSYEDVRWLAETLQVLTLSGWYYVNLDWQAASDMLKEASPGVFLIRNSGANNFIFSLSVQTEKGPTSVRLHYKEGYFRLDCDKSLERYMPRFRNVIELVTHYASAATHAPGRTVWVDREGCRHSAVLLRAPLRRQPASLLHCARLAVHRSLRSGTAVRISCAPRHNYLPLPAALRRYLGQYPYGI